MHPAFLDNLSWEIAEVYGAINDQILINLARYFPYYKPGDTLPRSAFAYQAAMLAQMGNVNKDTIRIIRNGLSGADEALKSALEQSVIDAVRTAQPELLDAVKKGILQPATLPAVVSPNQYRAFQLYYQQSADKLNLVNTVMLESTKSAYQQCITDVVADIELADRIGATQFALDVAAGETITGVSSWNTALRHAMDKLKNRGITGFVDHAGHQWSAEAYAAMDIRTTMFNTGRAAVWETNQTFGNDLYIVSYHNGARPLCYPWQNKVISITDNARTIQDLYGNNIEVIAQSNTSYGQPAGLFGINCKHIPNPFIPGVSVIEGQPQDKDANDKAYAESQEQRGLERKIREQKRDLLMMKEQGASAEEIRAQREKIRATDDEIDEFCEKTGRTRRQNREGVYTKREFPDKERYDVAKFEHQQKDAIEQFYKDGGAQQNFGAGNGFQYSTEIQTPNGTNGVVYSPTSSVEQAEEFAKAFADDVSYEGVDVSVANAINSHLLQFTKEYQYDSFGGISAPAENTPLGRKLNGRLAAYNRYNRKLILNRSAFKTIDSVSKNLQEQQDVVIRYIRNPKAAIIEDETSRKILEGSVKSKRAHVATNLVESLDHELGHALLPQIEKLDLFKKVKRSWGKYASSISGEATLSLEEYVSESFSAWRKGEKIRDKTLIKCFNAVKR